LAMNRARTDYSIELLSISYALVVRVSAQVSELLKVILAGKRSADCAEHLVSLRCGILSIQQHRDESITSRIS
jgi:hypothetical protein